MKRSMEALEQPPVRHREPAGDSLDGVVLLRGLSPYADGAQSREFGITIDKQGRYDLPLDYYYTLNRSHTLSCLDAMQLCEEFYKNDFHPSAVRVNSREHVFLDISKFGTSRGPADLRPADACRWIATGCIRTDYLAVAKNGGERMGKKACHAWLATAWGNA